MKEGGLNEAIIILLLCQYTSNEGVTATARTKAIAIATRLLHALTPPLIGVGVTSTAMNDVRSMVLSVQRRVVPNSVEVLRWGHDATHSIRAVRAYLDVEQKCDTGLGLIRHE